MQSPSSTNDGSLLVHSGTLIDGEGSRPGWLLIENGQVAGVGAPDEPLPPAVHLIDASNGYVVPGFVDIHCNGAGGAHCQDGADEALRTLQTMRSHGTTRLLASLVTASIDSLVSSIEQLHVAMDRDPALIGIHLEGPFLAPERVGAHDLRYLRHPDPQSIDRLLAAANGRLRKVTVAPELPGALDAISTFVEAGVSVAIGHTDCDYATARLAFERGATLVTHAFNAMAPITGRAPGVLGAAFATEHVTIEVIADGLHVHPASVALLFRAAPGRVALVTDAMAAAGAPAGRYRLGTVDVEVTDDRAVVAGTTTLAGSTLTPDRALQVAVKECGVPVDQAVAALTTTPALAIAEQSTPSLAPGHRAEVLVLDARFSVVHVVA